MREIRVEAIKTGRATWCLTVWVRSFERRTPERTETVETERMSEGCEVWTAKTGSPIGTLCCENPARNVIAATEITGTIAPMSMKGIIDCVTLFRASATRLKREESSSRCSKPAPVSKAMERMPNPSLTSHEGCSTLR